MAFLEAVCGIYPQDIDAVWNNCLYTLEMVGLEEKCDDLTNAFLEKLQTVIKTASCDSLGELILDVMLDETRRIIQNEYPLLEISYYNNASASYFNIEYYAFFEKLHFAGIDPIIIRNIIRSQVYQYFKTPKELLEFCRKDEEYIFTLVSAHRMMPHIDKKNGTIEAIEDVFFFDSIEELGEFGITELHMLQTTAEEAGENMLIQKEFHNALCTSLSNGRYIFMKMSRNAMLLHLSVLEEDGIYEFCAKTAEDLADLCGENQLLCGENCDRCWHEDVCIIKRNKYPQKYAFTLPENWMTDIPVYLL